ncbi:hypothetical protein F511_45586 [Dorcoceras hygrometricum]|uniref:Uncharacterized protein n=1 Tax=Dorcoceras hygrometricum TaxID=472368 RepID=A0A2Z7A3B0_9LAMI|nr:hypothetical protein F511_45586 [Dorcoceras hygrometricum]
MREKSYNAPELIQEDLLRTNGQGGDVELMEEEAAAGSSGAAAPSKKGPKKRRASTQPEKEARHEKKKKKKKETSMSGSRSERIPEEGRAPTPSKRATEDRPKSPPVIAITKASSPKKKGPGRVPPLDYTEDSLVSSPSGVVATSNGVGGGEVVRRLTRVHRAVTTTRRSFDEAMGQHDELVARLEELEALRVQEQRAVEA